MILKLTTDDTIMQSLIIKKQSVQICVICGEKIILLMKFLKFLHAVNQSLHAFLFGIAL